jgi:hypothetical protein
VPWRSALAYGSFYEFVYHATSATVHFSPIQLMRGVWGVPGEVRVDLTPVEARLADFGLYWGMRLAPCTDAHS